MIIKNKSKGFTLIEMIISMVLIAIMSSILVYIMVSIIGVMQDNRVRKQLLMDGYNATAKFVREFELIENESDLLLGYSNQIQFLTNINDVYYNISYQIDSGELQRTVGTGSAAVLCSNVSGQFEYYTKDHTYLSAPLSATQLLSVRRVRLVINMLNGANTEYIYIVDAFPENFRFSGGGS